MPLPLTIGTGRALSRGRNALAYTTKIKALAPVAYWPLAEPSGTSPFDESGHVSAGTYTAVTLGASGIGDGRTSALFVPAGSPRVAIWRGDLPPVFSGAAGTLMIWAKVSAAGVWADGVARYMASMHADASNQVYIRKNTAASAMQFVYIAGGTTEVVVATYAGAGWTHFAVTWDKSVEEVKAWTNGVQTGTTQGTLGTWAGSLATTNTVLGAISTAGANAWDGTLAHAALFDRALTPAQIAQAAVPT